MNSSVQIKMILLNGLSCFARLVTAVVVLLGPGGKAYGQGILLTLGDTNNGTISLPGQEDRFTFTGTAGQRLHFDRLGLDGEAINASMTSPSGISVFSLGSATDHGPFYLTEAGMYTVLLDGAIDATGSYSFRLFDVASAT